MPSDPGNATPDRAAKITCPHGCTTPLECLAFAQGGSVPSGCRMAELADHLVGTPTERDVERGQELAEEHGW